MIGNIYELYENKGYFGVKMQSTEKQVGYILLADRSSGYVPTYADILLPDGNILISHLWIVLYRENTHLPKIPKVGRIDMKYIKFFLNCWNGPTWVRPENRSPSTRDIMFLIFQTERSYRP